MQLNVIILKNPVSLVDVNKRLEPLKMNSIEGNDCFDFTPKNGVIPNWVKALPGAMIEGMEKAPLPPNPYGFEFWCRIVAGALI